MLSGTALAHGRQSRWKTHRSGQSERRDGLIVRSSDAVEMFEAVFGRKEFSPLTAHTDRTAIGMHRPNAPKGQLSSPIIG